MTRAGLLICTACLVFNASQAQTPSPQAPKPAPKPPTFPTEGITTLECAQWKAAIERGYKLNDDERTRYGQCISDDPTGGKWLAPPLETYVPKDYFTPNPWDWRQLLKPGGQGIDSQGIQS